ncbi:RIP metalloprotease RseP [Brevibacillus sp. 7WMA2]|uniref:Zinc metalloprotease n=3 Tax=Brevibacillus TaxID=55080 RepID=A0A075R4V4_BRELA|nr:MULTISPECIES: RIP metalloprotease RseP [Brevibacillus]HAS00777.1 RIP metalloprotease RseP [Brevibacillus sp.]AIG27577.1 regulator of sigma-W protease RasP [Brevibacillus laterosporus LMG 15441]AKF94592.1 zinc metalloprotease [Brevibacillus laterosporus]AUM65860.1 RIP metalloprotease RseP [Brevibacillus laterosporus]AYK08936.1 RIP metalloprotease RseP [Brevibacillus laterosporus]
MQMPPVQIGFGSVIAFVVIFGLLVFFHEMGHFLLAKRAGILCREFALGMGPKMFSFKRGETEYTLRWLPIGGMVRMAGEDPEMEVLQPHMEVGVLFNQANQISHIYVTPKDIPNHATIGNVVRYDLEHDLIMTLDIQGEMKTFAVDPKTMLVIEGKEVQIAPFNRQFKGKTIWQRFLAIFAGPAANFILAFVIFVMGALFFGAPSKDAVLGQVIPDGPAYQAGLKQGDRIISIDGTPINDWNQFVGAVNASPNKNIEMKINRDGQDMVVPVQVNEQGKIMVGAGVKREIGLALTHGVDQTIFWTKTIFTNLAQLFTGHVSVKDLSGPAGIFTMTSQFAQNGLAALFTWTALLSINLGIFNLLPIPALDGGRLVFIAIEALRGKPIDPNKEGMVHFVGFALLMMLILVVTWNDIQRLFLQ